MRRILLLVFVLACNSDEGDHKPPTGDTDPVVDPVVQEQDRDHDGYLPSEGDCDDADANVNPAAIEICDGIDNDCDATTDEFVDADNDGVSTICGDCDDDDADNFPGNFERCDGRDNDCDGVASPSEADTDSDTVLDCADCGPDDPTVYPGAPELCDGLDNNCNRRTDIADAGLTELCGTLTLSADPWDGWGLTYISFPPHFEMSALWDHDIDATLSDGRTYQHRLSCEVANSVVASVLPVRPTFLEVTTTGSSIEAQNPAGVPYSTVSHDLWTVSSGGPIFEDLAFSSYFEPRYYKITDGADMLTFDAESGRLVVYEDANGVVFDRR